MTTTAAPVVADREHTGPTRIIHVVSWVYWNGAEQGGGGFDWYPADAEAAALDAFQAERTGWGTGPARVRLLTLAVPATLDGQELTDWLDNGIDDLERHLAARKVALCLPAAA